MLPSGASFLFQKWKPTNVLCSKGAFRIDVLPLNSPVRLNNFIFRAGNLVDSWNIYCIFYHSGEISMAKKSGKISQLYKKLPLWSKILLIAAAILAVLMLPIAYSTISEGWISLDESVRKKWCCLVFGVFFLLASILITYGLIKSMLKKRLCTLPVIAHVKEHVHKSEMENTYEYTTFSEAWLPRLYYVYNGKKIPYDMDNVIMGLSRKRILKDFPIGSEHTLYINPNSPDYASDTCGLSFFHVLLYCICIIITIVIFGALSLIFLLGALS